MQLTQNDLRFVAQRLPRDVRELLKQHGGRLFVGGGFIRAIIAGEEISDIDIFGSEPEWLKQVAVALMSMRPGSKMHETKNAITILTPDRLPVQFITRWTFNDPQRLMESFDFTVCQAVVWREPRGNGAWHSTISEGFYVDLAGRRLVYISPEREEEAGGSMLRVIKYVKRGYSIQVSSLGHVIARIAQKLDAAKLHGVVPSSEAEKGAFIANLLREVDPLLVVDGMEVVDDHEPVPDMGDLS